MKADQTMHCEQMMTACRLRGDRPTVSMLPPKSFQQHAQLAMHPCGSMPWVCLRQQPGGAVDHVGRRTDEVGSHASPSDKWTHGRRCGELH